MVSAQNGAESYTAWTYRLLPIWEKDLILDLLSDFQLSLVAGIKFFGQSVKRAVQTYIFSRGGLRKHVGEFEHKL